MTRSPHDRPVNFSALNAEQEEINVRFDWIVEELDQKVSTNYGEKLRKFGGVAVNAIINSTKPISSVFFYRGR